MRLGTWQDAPACDALRTAICFALIPRFCSDHTIRWLEYVVVTQTYVPEERGWVTVKIEAGA